MAHLEVENNDNNIQISDEMIGPGLLTKGQFLTTWSTFYKEYFDFKITPAATLPIFAYLPNKPVYFNGMYDSSPFNDFWAYNLKSAGTEAQGGATVDYWIFDERAAESADNFGLALFDENGQPSFHSSSKPIRIVGSIRMDLPSSASVFWNHHNAGTMASAFSQTFPVPAGKTYAVVTGSPGFVSAGRNPLTNDTYIHYYASAVKEGSNIRVGLLFYRQEDWENAQTFFRQMGEIYFLIVDVTDY